MADSTPRHFEIGTDGPSVIVVGFDAAELGSFERQSSIHAALYAAGMARREGARLVVVWVRPQVAYADAFAEPPERIAAARAEAEMRLREAMEEGSVYYEVPQADLVIRAGEPFTELTRVADEVSADIVVVGASESRLGSLASRLIRDGRWPVTVVP